MASFYAAVMTKGGSALLAEAIAGIAKIEFTAMAAGDGEYSAAERSVTALQERTALKSQKQSVGFSSVAVESETGVKLVAALDNEEMTEGYYVKEVGLFAQNALDTNQEPVLYSICVAEVADYMPAYNGLIPTTIIQEYFATVNNSAEVALVAGSGAYALAEDFQKIENPDFNDTGEVEGIGSFTDFMASFVKQTSIYQFLANLKAGLKYVLHAGQLVNNGLTETAGKFPLDAAYGKVLTDQITQLNSDLENRDLVENDNAVVAKIKSIWSSLPATGGAIQQGAFNIGPIYVYFYQKHDSGSHGAVIIFGYTLLRPIYMNVFASIWNVRYL